VTVHNTGDVAAHELLVQLDGVTVVSGSNPALVGHIPGRWIGRRVVDRPGSRHGRTYPLTATIGSYSYGEVSAGQAPPATSPATAIVAT